MIIMLDVCTLLSSSDPKWKADVIVLVAGSYQERAPVAAQLFHDNAGRQIIVTNDGVFGKWSIKDNRNLYQVEWAEEELAKQGVPRDKIIKLPFYGSSTMHDALAVKRYSLEHKIESMIIVTSDYHIRRALWAFRKAFSGQPVSITAFESKSTEMGVGSRALEIVKTVHYKIRYGLLGMIPNMVEQHTFEISSRDGR